MDFNSGLFTVPTMKTVFVVGTKNSGKTTLSEFLVRSLSERGLRVATIKHIHHEFTIDTEGKDTFRMRQAGAKLVISFSPSEIAILRPPGNVEGEFKELSEQMATEGFDYLVVEGFKIMSAGIPSVFRILTCKTTAELDSLIPAMLPNIDCISGVVTALIAGNEYRGLPVIKFPAEGSELLRRVMAKAQHRDNPCVFLWGLDVLNEISVDLRVTFDIPCLCQAAGSASEPKR